MKILEDIERGYRKLFDATGKLEFFVLAQNVKKLNEDIMNIDLEVKETAEPELSI